MKAALKKALNKAAPHIAFEVSYEEDPNFTWDGDGPDPANEGFAAYNVKVQALTIIKGSPVEGNNYLGGTYVKYRERGPVNPDPDIGGYLPQMLDEALLDLVKTARIPPAWLKKEAKAAQAAVAKYAKSIH